jgi:alkylhydroperoxidase/carboxymuconolactone decarboxylase family protein YurZ
LGPGAAVFWPAVESDTCRHRQNGEEMFDATIGLVKAIFDAQGVDPKTREMIILRAAIVLDSPYEWQANTQMAKNVGLSPKEIDAAASHGPVVGINPEYVLVCKATDELSTSGTLRDETLRELLDQYGETIDELLPWKWKTAAVKS